MSQQTSIAVIFSKIVNDKAFVDRVDTGIKNIMKDGKVDFTDIPEIIFIITDTFNSLDSFKLKQDELLSLFEMLYTHLNNLYNIVPEDKQDEFKGLVESSLKLVMLKPKIKKMLFSCFAH